jgi:hypothetical protein
MAGCPRGIPAHLRRFRRCGVNRERKVVLMLIPSWAKFKEPQKVSEASLARIRARERERILSEEADKRHARRKARLDLIIKPQ